MKSNIEYETSEGYKYITDTEGRISKAEANLELGKADRNSYAQRVAGREGIQFNKAGWYTGKTNSGMPIKMWLNDKGLVDTAFPVYSK